MILALPNLDVIVRPMLTSPHAGVIQVSVIVVLMTAGRIWLFINRRTLQINRKLRGNDQHILGKFVGYDI
jgi:hypothetical protein